MTKHEFIDRVARKSGLSKREAAKAVDAVLDTISDALRSGQAVSFTGFGKFSAQSRAARVGVSPRTGERVRIAEARVPKFTPGTRLKQALRGYQKAALPGDPDVPWEDSKQDS